MKYLDKTHIAKKVDWLQPDDGGTKECQAIRYAYII
jgi:hypothetical protein